MIPKHMRRQKALDSGAKSDELTAVYQKLLYEVKLDYQLLQILRRA